ncbi:MAG: hypothetical protein LBJ13_02490 [Puniceicoccales bacterium]|jgi:hypothetical protein|nr:hypothetical protein [Puniceicoccales bacterium]
MEVSSNSDSGDIDPNVVEKAEKLSPLEKMKIAAEPSSTEKAGETVNIQQYSSDNSSDKIQEVSKTRDIQSVRQASNGGVFSGFKIRAGKSSGVIKNVLNGGFNVSDGSLTDRQ